MDRKFFCEYLNSRFTDLRRINRTFNERDIKSKPHPILAPIYLQLIFNYALFEHKLLFFLMDVEQCFVP